MEVGWRLGGDWIEIGWRSNVGPNEASPDGTPNGILHPQSVAHASPPEQDNVQTMSG